MHENVKKWIAFYAAVDDPLDSAIKGCTWGHFDGELKDALSDLYEDAQERACKDPVEVALELYLWLPLLMQ